MLLRDLRPKSVSSWIKATSSKGPRGKSQERRLVELGIGSQILRDLGVSEMMLLTNSPDTHYVGIEGYGLKIVGTRKLG